MTHSVPRLADMSTFRLRVESPVDQVPGSSVHEGIDRLGGKVLSVDLREIDGAAEVAEMVVDIPDAVDGTALRTALVTTTSASLLSSRPCERDEVISHAQQWVRSVDMAAAPGLSDRLMAACPLSMVWVSGADQSEVVPEVSIALTRRVPIVCRATDLPDQLSPTSGRASRWLLAVPERSAAAQTVALLTRPTSLRFTASEVARVELLMAS
jgi:hypothetical protein